MENRLEENSSRRKVANWELLLSSNKLGQLPWGWREAGEFKSLQRYHQQLSDWFAWRTDGEHRKNTAQGYQLIPGAYSQHIITKHMENSWLSWSAVNTTEMLLLLLVVIYQHCHLQTIFISTNYSRPNGETQHQESRSVLHFFLSMNITDR